MAERRCHGRWDSCGDWSKVLDRGCPVEGGVWLWRGREGGVTRDSGGVRESCAGGEGVGG